MIHIILEFATVTLYQVCSSQGKKNILVVETVEKHDNHWKTTQL